MKNKNKQNITYQKEKVVLSDILPYEVPVIFSNRYFYRFLVENKIEAKDNTIVWKSAKPNIKEVIELIFNSKVNHIDSSAEIYVQNESLNYNGYKKIPFTFKIAHKESDYRALSIMHPLNQIDVVSFYNEFKEIIKYFAGISSYSIRKPYKVAKYRFTNDYLHKNNKYDDFEQQSRIEIHDNDEEHLKSFFTYKNHSNIHRFFESYQYQRSEKKFNKLYKFDINKCFDSIYTHTIAWALYNKEIVKDNISLSTDTFAGKFDRLMQNMNYGETNGILIGSEVSRIFAELLLQTIDKNVENELYKEGHIHKKDYEIYRYVDDYFLFYDDEIIKNKIIDTFKHKLKEYNLFISETKSISYSKPIITDLTIAKTKITDLINEELSYKLSDIKDDDGEKRKWSIHLKSENLITKFKIIIKESNIEYKDIMNYTIAIIEKRVTALVNKFEKEENQNKYIKVFLSYILEVLNFLFFIYSVSPRVSATIKIVSLISKLIVSLKKIKILKSYQKDFIFKKIYDEIYQILSKNKIKKYTQNETLYLLITIAELGKNYRLEEAFLKEYFFNGKDQLNYFSITTLLYYIKDISRYEQLKIAIAEHIKNKFESYNINNLKKNTELVMLFFDLLTCPYVEKSLKITVLKIFGVDDSITQDNLIAFNQYWFIKWTDFNLAEEIEMKKSQEVYS